MNERIRELANQCNIGKLVDTWEYEEFAELIVKECHELNKKQAVELMGVIVDVEEGDGFDDVCLNTVKRVSAYLSDDLKNHFGIGSEIDTQLRNRSTYFGNNS